MKAQQSFFELSITYKGADLDINGYYGDYLDIKSVYFNDRNIIHDLNLSEFSDVSRLTLLKLES